MRSLYRWGVGDVNSSARTVDWSLISRDEDDIGQNSPSVQLQARQPWWYRVGLQPKAWIYWERRLCHLSK